MKWHKLALTAVVALGMGMAATAQAGSKPPVPESLAGVEIVGSDFVLDAMESGSANILDCRKANAVSSDGAVPTSFNCQVSSGKADVGDAEVAATADKLKAECADLGGLDKAKPIVTFCNGLNCWRSPKAALALVKLGFTNVKWYRLGMNDWKAQSLPLE
ncbi:rhodanese-like domain-containing protein [Magnetofaba australis]|uniref:Putative rhodanese n=1 Tax=Magnetofaba australis IT-1 TaxID=1434232 RepID=A0A1Y2K777_9PROT|nr:rhodanese-like domain-containing protein [Magnetofaba australis]OSM04212.1 putative rhodanese [Magnetofaba australis IT-1]